MKLFYKNPKKTYESPPYKYSKYYILESFDGPLKVLNILRVNIVLIVSRF